MYLDTATLFVTLLYKVDKIIALFRKDRFKVILVIFLLIAIPLTIFLVRQQQILKSRAAGEGTLTVVGSQGGFTAGSPPSTTNNLVTLQLTYGGMSNCTTNPQLTGGCALLCTYTGPAPCTQVPAPAGSCAAQSPPAGCGITPSPTPTQVTGQPTATSVPTSTAASPTPTTAAGASCSISGPDVMPPNTTSTYSVSGISCSTTGTIGTPGVCYWSAQFSSYPFVKTFDSKSTSVLITPVNDGVPSGAVKLGFQKPGPYGGPAGTYCSKDITVGTTSGPGSSSCTACAADLDTSGFVDGVDSAIANLCKIGYPNFPGTGMCAKLDFNSDSSINQSEADCVSTKQGQTCAQ